MSKVLYKIGESTQAIERAKLKFTGINLFVACCAGTPPFQYIKC